MLLLAGVCRGADVDYSRDVKTVLAEHCYRCHGASQQKGGIRVDTALFLQKGGDSGPGYVAGDPEKSLLIQAVKGTHEDISRMPYKKPPLSDEQIEKMVAWVKMGAPAPADEKPESKIHWSFIAPEKIRPPTVEDDAWVRNSIDKFILARLEKEKLKPSPEADKVTLIRRLHLDLIGLPPTPQQVDEFLADNSADSYERLVESLLKSPHYGERWGRHWLDVARYADSNGYSIDSPRSMWKYRDWVINALNKDMPFDQFTIEQLAGDIVENATIEQKIATGFHRNTQINEEGGIDPEQFRIESVFDRVNTTATAWLGLTVACAQCHDHKFDAITQKEYYQLFAFLNNQDEPTLELPTPQEKKAREEHQAKVAGLEQQIKELAVDDPTKKEKEKKLAALKKKEPKITTTLVMAERAEPRKSHLFIKGDFTRHGEQVYPGTIKALHPFQPSPATNRLDLARWIVSKENPLTARVIVNRIWQQYFGKGIVETENDFGTQGIPPTHPELLDWLAQEFVAKGWSMKNMHLLIVSSATYRQSSKSRDDLWNVDAANKLLARQNRLRLDSEVVRDVGLSASGLLNTKIGGPSAFPLQPDGVMTLGQVKRTWTPKDQHRRGLYTFFYRATPHPALMVFDSPDGFSTCTRRMRSNTPLQALTLLNDKAFYEFAEALAKRIEDKPADEGIQEAFRLCLGREPKLDELEVLAKLYKQELGNSEENRLAALTSVSRVLLNLDETITRE